jgi:glycosyltransferase involved in cell wall biosynthesis
MYNDPAFSPRKRSLFVWLERLTVWPSHCIVAVSKSCLEHYDADRIGRKLERYVVYSGIDVQRFEQNSQLSAEKRALLRKELGFAEPDVVLINVGRFTYGKAQRHTIAAFAQLRKKHNHLKLLLVGEGDLQAQCREQAQQLGVAQDVVFYGFTENVPQIMGLADINVLTSLREGLPRVVVEASLCGLPTAAFEVEGIREILTDGQTGFIVPQEDEEALANALDILITQPEKRKRFASEAKMHARQHWSHHTMVAELDKIYEHYLRKKRIWK